MPKTDPLHVPESIFGRMHTGAKLGFEATNGVCFDFLREGSLIPLVIFENDSKKLSSFCFFSSLELCFTTEKSLLILRCKKIDMAPYECMKHIVKIIVV